MSIAPRFSPDGNRMVMSVSIDGNSEIFQLDLRNRVQQRLTRHPAIDTAPSYSPDGESIAFESDRSGRQQLYVMKADGGDAQRISFGEGRYATPVWSPRGDWIAFTKSHEGVFHIGAMRTDGSGERLLSSGFLVEGPTWAPNGRVLMFYRNTPGDDSGRGDRVRLFSIDLDGPQRARDRHRNRRFRPRLVAAEFPELTASGGETPRARDPPEADHGPLAETPIHRFNALMGSALSGGADR